MAEPAAPVDEGALLAAATAARRHAYAPYSGFAVGAALLLADGGVVHGCNVENAALGPSICAERTAVVSAVAGGRRGFVAIAVTGPDERPITPCGVCRQVLWEFAPDLRVVTHDGAGGVRSRPLRELLPDAFGPDRLG